MCGNLAIVNQVSQFGTELKVKNYEWLLNFCVIGEERVTGRTASATARMSLEGVFHQTQVCWWMHVFLPSMV